MALKALVAVANSIGIPTGQLLGVNDDTLPLPPLPKSNAGAVIAKWVATTGQGVNTGWDKTTEAFVAQPAPAAAPAQSQQVSASVTFAVASGQVVKTAAIPVPVDTTRAVVSSNGPYTARLLDANTVEFTVPGIALGIGTFTVWATVQRGD